MESFYSIIYYKTNALTDEMVSIGMLAGGGEGPFMYISNARMNMLRKVLHPNTFISVRRHVKFLFEKVEKHRNEAAGILLFDPVFSVEQMEILSQHSKNAVVYSPPTTINDWLDAKFFSDLAQAFFGETIKNESKRRPLFHLKWEAFYTSNIFNSWERNISISSLLPASPLSLTIDLAMPEEKKLIKGINFDLSETTLKIKLYELDLIINSMLDYAIIIIYPVPKKNSGKRSLEAIKKKYPRITFQVFSEFKKMN